MQYSAVSLFSGCGGSDLGLRQAGIESIWANDKDESACELYENVVSPGVIHAGDISNYTAFPKADILAGCYPCQGYSQGGRRQSKDKINYLYQEFDRALRTTRPIAFIAENVNGMRFSQNRHLLDNQLVRYRLAGYSVTWQVLDAKDFGLAQDRKRLFIVGIRSSENIRYSFPKPTHGYQSELNIPYVTLKETIWKYRKAPADSYNVDEFHWYYLSRNRRREWSQQSPCIVANWRHVGLHPDSVPLKKINNDKWEFIKEGFSRRYSYIECAALQGFPDPTAFNSRTILERFRAIGNAVPPPLFAAVAKRLVKQLQR